MSLIHVKAAAGMKMPKEGNPRSYITDAAPETVEGTHYYRKALIDGDLVELSDKEMAAYQAKVEAAAKGSAPSDKK